MDTPIDVPQDANPIIDDNNPRRNVAVRTTVRVRGVYVRLNSPNEQEAGDSPPAVANTPQQQQQPQPVIVLREREVIRKSPRCCYCFLMLPFLLALAALIISVVTFAIKNEDVKAKCSNITCVLNCGESIKNDCWVVLGGEAGLSLITIIYIVLLMCRLCRQSKLYCCCVLIELLVLFVLLAGSMLVAAFLSIGIETDTSCSNHTLGQCEENIDVHDLFDFLRQSEFTAWISSACYLFTVSVWIMMVLCYLPKTRHHDETLPLITN